MHFLTVPPKSQGLFIEAAMEGEVVIQEIALDEGSTHGIAVYAPGWATPAIQDAYPWTYTTDMTGGGFAGWTRFFAECPADETGTKWEEILELIRQL